MIRIWFSHWFIRVQGDGSAGNIPASSLSLLNSSSCWSTAMQFLLQAALSIRRLTRRRFFFAASCDWPAEVSLPCMGETRLEGPSVTPEETGVADRLGVPSVQHSWVGSQVARQPTVPCAGTLVAGFPEHAGPKILCFCVLKDELFTPEDELYWADRQI